MKNFSLVIIILVFQFQFLYGQSPSIVLFEPGVPSTITIPLGQSEGSFSTAVGY
ncbi:MAG: hypothetical protein JW995_13270 [Melioribacteraceae bacterium]|nr:hypothetical protein [Melioribacteraceae bacterium]